MFGPGGGGSGQHRAVVVSGYPNRVETSYAELADERDLTSDLSTVGYVASVTPEACEVTFSRNRLLTDQARLGSLNNRGF